MAKTVVLPSGKKVNADWQPSKSEFTAVMVVRKPYRDMIPSKAKQVIEKDYKALQGTFAKKKKED